jgi:hypothetical protein
VPSGGDCHCESILHNPDVYPKFVQLLSLLDIILNSIRYMFHFVSFKGTTAGVLTAIPLVNTAATTAPCDDIDSHACALMHSTRPDLCSDESLANAACKRYCGKCRKHRNVQNKFADLNRSVLPVIVVAM